MLALVRTSFQTLNRFSFGFCFVFFFILKKRGDLQCVRIVTETFFYFWIAHEITMNNFQILMAYDGKLCEHQ